MNMNEQKYDFDIPLAFLWDKKNIKTLVLLTNKPKILNIIVFIVVKHDNLGCIKHGEIIPLIFQNISLNCKFFLLE